MLYLGSYFNAGGPTIITVMRRLGTANKSPLSQALEHDQPFVLPGITGQYCSWSTGLFPRSPILVTGAAASAIRHTTTSNGPLVRQFRRRGLAAVVNTVEALRRLLQKASAAA